jgi:hypothetical protein
MVYYDSTTEEIVVLCGQSPARGTYSISVTGSVKSATGYECSSFTFDLAVCSGQSCSTTIGTDTTTSSSAETATEAEHDVTEQDVTE